MADSSPPPIEKIIERAYFHVGNGGMTLSIIEDRSPKDGATSYRFKHEMSVFGAKSEGSFPLGSSDIVSWMNMALQRVSMKVAAAFADRSFQPFDNPVEVTHSNGEEVAKLASLFRIVARFQRRADVVGYEFPSPEARREYLKEHPAADPAKHTVKRPEEKEKAKEPEPEEKEHGEHEEKPKKSWKERFQSLSDKAKSFVKNAPAEIKKFVEDDAHRRKVAHAMHKAVVEMPGKVVDNAKKAIKHEAKEFKTAGEGIATVLSGKPMTKEQKHAVKTVAFDVALTVATAAVTGGFGGIAGRAAAGFTKALAKKIALKSMTHGLGKVTTMEELAHFSHGVLEHITEAITAAENAGEGAGDLITSYVSKLVADELEDLDPEVLADALEEASKESGD